MRRGLIGGCIVAAVLALDTLAWAVATAQLKAAAKRWIAQGTAHGWTISRGAFASAGWPLAATVTVPGFAMEGGGQLMPGGLAWSSRRLVASLSLLHPATLLVAAEGAQALRLSHAPALAFTAGQAGAAIQLWGRHAMRVDLRADALNGGLAGSRHTQDVQIASLRLRLESRAGGAPDAIPSALMRLEATGIVLPDNGRWPLGATVARLAGTLALTSPATGPAGDAAPASQARAWRDGGGQLAAQDVHVRWGPLGMDASATLGLDARLQPAGSGTADITGSQDAVQALAGAGILPPGLAATAAALLAVMPSTPGHPDAVRLPFVLHDNTVAIGQIPVFRLADIAWR